MVAAAFQRAAKTATRNRLRGVGAAQDSRHFESEWVPTGRVISARMIHAWAIIRRLSTLLKAREQADASKKEGSEP